jgi:aldose 1-epimerase
MISPERRRAVIGVMAATPSGRQFELNSRDQHAVVTEVGAGLRTYSAAGYELLDGYPPDALASSGRGQLLLPWPNRIRDGVYHFEGREHRLPLNEPERGNAIHGLVRWSSWRAVEQTADRIVLEHVLHPQPGYPFTLELRTEYSLEAEGLSVRTIATNLGAEPCPYGAGAHPYLAVAEVDQAVLRLPARTVLETDDRGIPTSSSSVDGAFDFRTPREVGGLQLDHCFTDLQRDADGLARVGVDGTTLSVDESYPYLMVFTGDALPGTERRRSIAVEPMTCAPNAFVSGDGLIVLEPGEEHAAAWGITPPTAA